MTKSIDSIKMNIVKTVSSIDDFDKLTSIAEFVGVGDTMSMSFNDLEPIEVLPIPSFEELFVKQGSKKILFDQLPKVDEDWDVSIDELLAAL